MSALTHYGIPNQKWGKRRYRNYDGTLTLEGKERYKQPVVKPHISGAAIGGAVSTTEIEEILNKLEYEDTKDRAEFKKKKTAASKMIRDTILKIMSFHQEKNR